MSKRCPNCLESYNDKSIYCAKCGSQLVKETDTTPTVNISDDSAIVGGVNINQSKNITSYDTHYHSTTISERTKSDYELKLEATNKLRAKAEEIISTIGRIDSVAIGELRPYASHLGIDDETFKSIIKDVRTNRNGNIASLSTANTRYLQQAWLAIQTNDIEQLQSIAPRLEAIAAISQDNDVQYLHYLTLSLIHSTKSTEVYEHQTDESYWRTFWAIVSYIRLERYAEAAKILATFEPSRFDKPEEDLNLLEAYFNTMQDDKDAAQEFLDEILGEPSKQITTMLRAIEKTLYKEETEDIETKFYLEQILTKSVETEITPQKQENITPANSTKDHKEITTNEEAKKLYSEASVASGSKRIMLLQKAAEAGSADAMYDLGDMYYDGEEVEKNLQLAIKWLQKAADQNHTVAQAALGVFYCYGDDEVEQNYPLAEKYLTLAAEKDFVEAQANLSMLYILIEEYSKALLWARKAAQSGHSLGYYILGRISSEGLGVRVNHLEGLKYYEKAAEYGNSKAQNIVANYYANGEHVPLDEEKAFKYYQMAALNGDEWAMYNLGCCYINKMGCSFDIAKSLEWFNKAANAGIEDAQEWIDNYTPNKFNGINNDLDFANTVFDYNNTYKAKECFEIYKKYASKNIPQAQFQLAQCYHLGFGIERDLTKAKEWFFEAEKSGYTPSSAVLGLNFGIDNTFCVTLTDLTENFCNQDIEELLYNINLDDNLKSATLYHSGNIIFLEKEKASELIKRTLEAGYKKALETVIHIKQIKTEKETSIYNIKITDINIETSEDIFSCDELIICFEWTGPKSSKDKPKLAIDLLNNNEVIRSISNPMQKARFRIPLGNQGIKLTKDSFNKFTFYVTLHRDVYRSNKYRYLDYASIGPIDIEIYYKHHLFKKNEYKIKYNVKNNKDN